MQRIMDLASIGAIDGGGCARLALTDEDAAGRDLVVGWMHELGLTVTTDVIGNVIGTWNVGAGLPVMTGSHIDTVRTGGKYDGNLGVLARYENHCGWTYACKHLRIMSSTTWHATYRRSF